MGRAKLPVEFAGYGYRAAYNGIRNARRIFGIAERNEASEIHVSMNPKKIWYLDKRRVFESIMTALLGARGIKIWFTFNVQFARGARVSQVVKLAPFREEDATLQEIWLFSAFPTDIRRSQLHRNTADRDKQPRD